MMQQIAFYGKVDVHQAMHDVGVGLTENLKDTPHGESLLFRLPIIGYLID